MKVCLNLTHIYILKYILELLNETIDLRKKTNIQIQTILETKKYDLVENDYNYLIKMSMDSVSIENVDSLKKQHDLKQKELDIVKTTQIEVTWLSELTELEKVL